MGKIIKIDEYNFTYGKGTDYLNVFGGFKYKEDGNKYVIYSHDNTKLFYGSLFIKDNKLVIMDVKNDVSSIIKEFTHVLLDDKKSTDFEVISLDDIDSVEIIGENTVDIDSSVILNLFDKTIPKELEKPVQNETKKSKSSSVVGICLFLLIVIVGAFFWFNPEIIEGEKRRVICDKTYIHESLNATVTEEVTLTFSGKDKITDIDLVTDYKFNNSLQYEEFVKKNYYYQYMKEGDTYKLDNSASTYRVFSSIDTEVDFFLPTSYKELVEDYKNKGYDCRNVEVSE